MRMHYVQAKGILSHGNGMNLYRGCQHGCIYCDARSRCYRMDHDFEDIAVKQNALQLLERALRSKRKPCMIGTGAMSDPYMPLEEELRMTRRSLELIEQYGFGATVQTKSDRVLRDLDILARINEKTRAVVQMTLTTADEALCSLVEPGVCTTAARAAALDRFRAAGIPTVVWLCPVLPFLNDTEENIRQILEICLDTGVRGIIQFGMGLTLREGNREYFYAALDEKFPGLKARYIRSYGNSYELPSPNAHRLMGIFRETCEKYGLLQDSRELFAYLGRFEDKESAQQMSWFE